MDAILIRELRKTYASGTEALKGISLTIAEGDFFALLGVNGAGKSTTIGILTGLVQKTAGTVTVCGYDLDTQPEEVKQCIGVVPQEFNFNIFEKVGDIVVNQAGYYGIPRARAWERAEEVLTKLHLWDKKDVQSKELSGGMKRRLMIARALVHEPRVLILDEPTAGVDVELRRGMWEYLQELNAAGTTILLTTHYLEEVEQLCRNAAVINNGKIVLHNSVRQLMRSLEKEVYIATSHTALPQQIVGENVQRIDDHTLALTLPATETLTAALGQLSAQGVIVQSVRPQSNRMEQLFLDTIQKSV